MIDQSTVDDDEYLSNGNSVAVLEEEECVEF